MGERRPSSRGGNAVVLINAVLVLTTLESVRGNMTCGGTATPWHTFTAPNYTFSCPDNAKTTGESYRNAMEHSYNYVHTSVAGARLAVIFNNVRFYKAAVVGCSVSSVSIHDGPDFTAPIIARMCTDSGARDPAAGSLDLPPIVTSGNSFAVEYTTNAAAFVGCPPDGSQYGYVVSYLPTSAPPSGACAARVNLTNSYYGVITSPFPYVLNTKYSPAKMVSYPWHQCSWLVTGATHVEISILDMQFPTTTSRIILYDGNSRTAPLLYSIAAFEYNASDPRLIDRTVLGPVRSSGPNLLVYQEETVGNAFEGFKWSYTAHNISEQCAGDYPRGAAPAGFIQQPYPYDGVTTTSGADCRFTVDIASVSPELLALDLLAMDIPGGQLTLLDASCENVVADTPVLWEGSGTQMPVATIVASGQTACVDYRGGGAAGAAGTGFKLGYGEFCGIQQCSADFQPQKYYSARSVTAPRPYDSTQSNFIAEEGMECQWQYRTAAPLDLIATQLLLQPSPACADMGVEVYEGLTLDPKKLLGRFCSSDVTTVGSAYLPHVRPGQGPNGTYDMTVRYYSNVNATVPGLSVAVDAASAEPNTTYPQVIKYCAGATRVVTNLSAADGYKGTFSSTTPFQQDGDIVGYAAENQNCTWTIDGGPNGRLVLVFNNASRFAPRSRPASPADPFDAVRVFEGPTIDSPLGAEYNWTSATPWARYVTDNRYVTVQYITDGETGAPVGDNVGFEVEWIVACPNLHKDGMPGRTVTRTETTMRVVCDASTPCGVQETNSYCDPTTVYWDPPPTFCYDSCSIYSPPLVCDATLAGSPVSELRDCTCALYPDEVFVVAPYIHCSSEMNYGLPFTATCPAVSDYCAPPSALVVAIFITQLVPDLMPLAGGVLTIKGTSWSMPLKTVTVADVTFPPANITTIDHNTVSVQAPAHPGGGYATVELVDARGLVTAVEFDLFYTDDCPVKGQYGLGAACRDCPEGGYCPGGNRVWPLPGYWNEGESAGYVLACPNPSTERCLGGRTSPCGAGYTGALCAQCIDGYYQSGIQCVPCPPLESQTALYVVNAILFFFLSVAFVALPDEKLDYVVRFFKILQILRAAGERSGASLPAGMRYINDYLSLTTFDYNFLQPACAGAAPTTPHFAQIFWGNGIVILCLVGPATIMLALLALLNRSRRALWLNRMVRTIIICGSLIYFVVATRVLQSISCVDINGTMVLRADTTAACAGNPVVVVGAIGLALFTLGMPATYLYTLTRLYRTDSLRDHAKRMRFGYMYRRLRTTRLRFLFEVLGLLHYFLLAISWNVLPSGRSPYALSIFSYCAVIVAIIAWRPFFKARDTGVTVASYGLGLASTVANLMTLNVAQYTSGASIGVVVALGVVVLLIALAVFIDEYRNKEKSKFQSDAPSLSKESLSSSSSASASKSGSGSGSGSEAPATPRKMSVRVAASVGSGSASKGSKGKKGSSSLSGSASA